MVAGIVLVTPGCAGRTASASTSPMAWMFGPIVTPAVGEVYLRRRWTRLGPEGVVPGVAGVSAASNPSACGGRWSTPWWTRVAAEAQNMTGPATPICEAARRWCARRFGPRFNRLIDAVEQPVRAAARRTGPAGTLAAAEGLLPATIRLGLRRPRRMGHTPQMRRPSGSLDTVGLARRRRAAAPTPPSERRTENRSDGTNADAAVGPAPCQPRGDRVQGPAADLRRGVGEGSPHGRDACSTRPGAGRPVGVLEENSLKASDCWPGSACADLVPGPAVPACDSPASCDFQHARPHPVQVLVNERQVGRRTRAIRQLLVSAM